MSAHKVTSILPEKLEEFKAPKKFELDLSGEHFKTIIAFIMFLCITFITFEAGRITGYTKGAVKTAEYYRKACQLTVKVAPLLEVK